MHISKDIATHQNNIDNLIRGKAEISQIRHEGVQKEII